MKEGAREKTAERPVSAEAVGALVAFVDSRSLDRRHFRIVNRLRAVHDSDEFATLPEDLRERVREIVAGAGD
jgi:hypothetical protein